jgi:hypothetical protein
MSTRLLQLWGLGFDICGAIVVAVAVITTKKGALEVGVPQYADEDPEKNLQLPAVRDRLRASWIAILGTSLLVIGFALQFLAAW